MLSRQIIRNGIIEPKDVSIGNFDRYSTNFKYISVWLLKQEKAVGDN